MSLTGIVYRTDTGEIVCSGTTSQAAWPEPLAANEKFVPTPEVYQVGEVYFDRAAGEVKTKPTMPITVSKRTLAVDEVIIIDNIPSGAKVDYPDGSITVNDGFIQWESAIEGSFVFQITKSPYKTEVILAQVK